MKTQSIAGTSHELGRASYERTRDIAADSTFCQGISQLSVESLTQVLVIHLLQHYSKSARIVTSESRSLTHAQLQRAIDYIHAHLDRELSLAEIAQAINISPTYFASLFKRAMGISPHQYVIQQRVEQAKLMLSKTDLAITLRDSFAYRRHCLTSRFF